MRNNIFGSALCLGLLSPASAYAIEFAASYEAFNASQTAIDGLQRVYVGEEIAPGLSFGQSIYSAAKGDAGGAFFWGVELQKDMSWNDRTSVNAALFLGGGGGASEVSGDGTMGQVRAGLGYRLSDALELQVAATWTRILGTEINDPGLSFGLAYMPNATPSSGGPGEHSLSVSGVSVTASRLSAVGGARTRSGAIQPDLSLVGVEGRLALGGKWKGWAAAAGAADGGEGYMQVLGGIRRDFSFGRVTGYAAAGAGFGGGGQVDTGGGLLFSAALGAAIPISRLLDLETALVAYDAPDGTFAAKGVSLQLVRNINRVSDDASGEAQHWMLTIGVSRQEPNTGFRKAGATLNGAPLMQESSLDLFVGDHFYLTGNAQTTIAGNVGGYAIGLLGIGYEMLLNDSWFLSAETHIGAAGGGGVDTGGGPIGGARLELDYALANGNRLSMGVGKLFALKSGGMAPTVIQFGIKFPFETK